MNFEWISKLISQRFGTHFGVHFGILGGSRGGLGSWGLASSDFDRFWIDFGTLGAKLAPTSRPWSVLGRLDTSWGGPCVVWNPFFSDLISNSFSHFMYTSFSQQFFGFLQRHVHFDWFSIFLSGTFKFTAASASVFHAHPSCIGFNRRCQ